MAILTSETFHFINEVAQYSINFSSLHPWCSTSHEWSCVYPSAASCSFEEIDTKSLLNVISHVLYYMLVYSVLTKHSNISFVYTLFYSIFISFGDYMYMY